MKRRVWILLLLPLLTTGCATSVVRDIGQTTVFDGPRVVIVWTNGDVAVKDARYTITAPRQTEHILTQRYYRIARKDMINAGQHAATGQTVALQYDKFPILSSDPAAKALDTAEAAGRSMATPDAGIGYVYCISKGFGGVDRLAYPGDVHFRIGPQLSQKVDEYRTTWGKWLQPLIVVAIPVDIVTSPVQAVYFLWRLNNSWKG